MDHVLSLSVAATQGEETIVATLSMSRATKFFVPRTLIVASCSVRFVIIDPLLAFESIRSNRIYSRESNDSPRIIDDYRRNINENHRHWRIKFEAITLLIHTPKLTVRDSRRGDTRAAINRGESISHGAYLTLQAQSLLFA